MPVQLRAGSRLESATSDVQVVVVRAPAGADVDLRCGGVTMREIGSSGEREPGTARGEPLEIGKRYADEELGLEVLCTRAGEGPLAVGETTLPQKGAKPLPASD